MLPDPLKFQEIIDEVHKNAPLEKNYNILFRNITIGSKPFLDLFSDSMVQSGTTVGGWKLLRRALRALNLAQYYDYSLGIDGGRVECGVFKGFSALMMGHIQRLNDPQFRGNGLHLIDSFEGLSEMHPADAAMERDTGTGEKEPVYGYKKGHFATPLEAVQETMRDFPEATIHKGWIPEVLETLPEQKWAFVHIDVDLYEPTLGCLEYFTPRMASGGCILNDDFSSPMFPGGFAAWSEFCTRHNFPYVAIDSGQAVLIAR
ncbi:MAG: TylF/MycF/NovP-related O-methyltransferase [Rhodospirillales bacterium]